MKIILEFQQTQMATEINAWTLLTLTTNLTISINLAIVSKHQNTLASLLVNIHCYRCFWSPPAYRLPYCVNRSMFQRGCTKYNFFEFTLQSSLIHSLISKPRSTQSEVFFEITINSWEGNCYRVLHSYCCRPRPALLLIKELHRRSCPRISRNF